MLGQDPLPGTLHQAQLAGPHQGPFSQVRIEGPPVLVVTQPPGRNVHNLPTLALLEYSNEKCCNGLSCNVVVV